jgi:HEPN domain-containing protein
MLAPQGVEKSIKAVLAARGVDFPFTHDIGALVGICNNAGVSLPEDLRDVDQLTPYARVRLEAAERSTAADDEPVD